jgi:hypothetical protein
MDRRLLTWLDQWLFV